MEPGAQGDRKEYAKMLLATCDDIRISTARPTRGNCIIWLRVLACIALYNTNIDNDIFPGPLLNYLPVDSSSLYSYSSLSPQYSST